MTERVISAAVIGTGEYATAIVTQAHSMPTLDVSVVADTNPDAAHRAYELAGIPEDRIVVAGDASSARDAFASGKKVIVEDGALIMDLPVDVIAECTGNTAAGARHAVMAIERGKHVVMITKEVDAAVGPILRKRAQDAGVIYTAADGDQPALLIALIAWSRRIGLEVLCGGKFGERRLMVDLDKRQVRTRSETLDLSDDQVACLQPFLDDRPGLPDALVARNTFFGKHVSIRTDDLTEQCIAANATGLAIEREFLHHPIVWPNEMPSVLRPKDEGGILDGRGVIDQATYLRSDNDTSMGGGVFVTVHADNVYSREILSGKGHIGSADGGSVLLFRPYHLCGVETPYSLLAAAVDGHPTAGWSMDQRYDVYVRATRDFPAGMQVAGPHEPDWQAFLAPATVFGQAAPSNPIPYHFATGLSLSQDVPSGEILTQDAVEGITKTELYNLRLEQDQG